MPFQEFQLPEALTLHRQRLEENNLKAALSPNAQMFVKAPPLSLPVNLHINCILVPLPSFKAAVYGCFISLRRRRRPRGAHLQRRTRIELCRGNCFNLGVIEFAPPHTLTRGPGGHASPRINMYTKPRANPRKRTRLKTTATQVDAGFPSSLAPPQRLSQRLTYILFFFFPFSCELCLLVRAGLGGFLHKCLKRCESFNDWD